MTISRGTKRITMERVLGEVESRKQTLVSVSQPENIMNGTITFVCIAGHEITTNVRAYLSCPPTKTTGLKSGCRVCGSKKAKKKKNEDSSLLKPTKVLAGIFKNIKDLNSLLQFLKENPNEYNDFILKQIKRGKPLNTPDNERHHILPLHMGGPDEPWNLVSLSFDEHTLAHDLRAAVYQSLSDTLATNFRKGVSPEKVQRMVNASMVNPQVKEALEKDIVLKHPDLDHVVVIPGGTAVLPVELLPILLGVLPENSKFREKLVKVPRRNFGYTASLFLRQNTNKKSCYGFYHKDALKKPLYRAKDDRVVKPLVSSVQRLKEKMVWSHPHFTENLIFPPNSVKHMIDLKGIFLEALPFGSPDWKRVKNVANFTGAISKVITGERSHYSGFRLVKN